MTDTPFLLPEPKNSLVVEWWCEVCKRIEMGMRDFPMDKGVCPDHPTTRLKRVDGGQTDH